MTPALSDDPNRIVPPTGIIAWLTVLVSAAMAFLAVFALLLLFATDRLADRWGSELARTATVRLSVPPDALAEATATTLAILEQTPGVSTARALDAEERAALLEPWLGPDVPVESLPIPGLIEIIQADPGIDAEGLRLRLEAEVPGATLDDHSIWRDTLDSAADRLRLIGWIGAALIVVSLAAMVTLAARASLASNAQVISVLRLIGARDQYVARAFTRRFTLRAAAGAALGTIAGLAVSAALPGESETGFLTSFRFAGLEWAASIVIPVIAAGVAFVATRTAALTRLRDTP